jgi:hypothetical protein
VIDVEQRPLRALEQNALAFAPLLLEQRPNRIHERQHQRRSALEFAAHLLGVDLIEVKSTAQRIVMREKSLDLAIERRAVGQIHQADGAAPDFVFVGGADAASRRADGQRGVGGFADRIEFAVQRQNERSVLGDAQIVRRHGNPLGAELADFVDQRARIEHHAVADDGKLARPYHSGGKERQLVGRAADHQRMAGIVPALKADDDVGLFGQPIDDLAFAFVAPLGADHDNICHEEMSPSSLMHAHLYSDSGRSRSG